MTIYYFIGIKGSGMSSLAQILHDQGYQVLGSDIDQYTFTQIPLVESGIKVLSFNAENLKENYTVIVGNAFDDQNVEVKRAKELNLPIFTYPQIVEQLINRHVSIGIAGAHGKTSTTGILVSILNASKPTSYLIGDGSGKGEKDGQYFVFEADEYQRHFLEYTPDYAIITNIDFDHPDYFKDINDVTDAFAAFVSNVKKTVIAWGDDQQIKKVASKKAGMIFYGLNDDNDYIATNIKKDVSGSSFDLNFHNQKIGNFKTPLYGEHGILNAMAAIIVALLEKVDVELIQIGLNNFQGVKRRFAQKQVGDITIIDDYAHHPSEITATLDAARQKFPQKKIVAVFQPHTFSRVVAYKDQFAESLDLADDVFLVEIFGSAREQHGNITSEDLGSVTKKFRGTISENNLGPLMKIKDAVIVFMGAGDIGKYENLYEQLLTQSKKTF